MDRLEPCHIFLYLSSRSFVFARFQGQVIRTGSGFVIRSVTRSVRSSAIIDRSPSPPKSRRWKERKERLERERESESLFPFRSINSFSWLLSQFQIRLMRRNNPSSLDQWFFEIFSFVVLRDVEWILRFFYLKLDLHLGPKCYFQARFSFPFTKCGNITCPIRFSYLKRWIGMHPRD